jgi:protein-S-isoprenylcysteine O-methyltransferase Ste14
MTLHRIAIGSLIASWVVFAAVFLKAARRVPEARLSNPDAEIDRRTDPMSNWGLLLQALSYFMVFFRRWNGIFEPDAAVIAGAILAPVSVALAAYAVRHLGMQWRVQAVVTRAHKLVQTGPYSFVRHPIYTAMFGMLLSSGLVSANWKVLLVAIVVFAFGTEIRIRAEEGLLEQRFGSDLREYRSRVRGWIPFIR